jgi:hypothetical protein
MEDCLNTVRLRRTWHVAMEGAFGGCDIIWTHHMITNLITYVVLVSCGTLFSTANLLSGLVRKPTYAIYDVRGMHAVAKLFTP